MLQLTRTSWQAIWFVAITLMLQHNRATTVLQSVQPTG
jgi:hypothetical protein